MSALKSLEEIMITLIEKYGAQKANSIIKKLEKIKSEIDFSHETEGLEIFVSDKISTILSLPFIVEEKTIISNAFEIQELLFYSKSLFDYFILALSKKSTRLFKGSGMILTEVKDGNFPMMFLDEYEYPKSYHGSKDSYSLKGVDDKSILLQKRMKTFFRKIERLLDLYTNGAFHLVLAGTKKNLSGYLEVTKHKDDIISNIPGNFDYCSETQLKTIVKPEIEKYSKKESGKIIEMLTAMSGTGKIVWGIAGVFDNVIAGNINILILEKDFGRNIAEYQLYLLNGTEYGTAETIGMVVDEIIEKVLRKNKRILFTENGKLNKYGGIALILEHRN